MFVLSEIEFRLVVIVVASLLFWCPFGVDLTSFPAFFCFCFRLSSQQCQRVYMSWCGAIECR